MKEDLNKELFDAITRLSRDDALRLTQALLDAGEPPADIMGVGREAMGVIGDRFESGEYFLPELIISGEILEAAGNIVKPYLEAGEGDESQKDGTIVFGTVEGDIHDIAKDIVVFMLEINGFEVIDLGVDVPVARFVEAVKEHNATMLGLSGFLTLAIEPMRQTVAAMKEAGLDDVKIMVGGGPVNDLVREDTKADDWGLTAMDAVSLAKKWSGVAA